MFLKLSHYSFQILDSCFTSDRTYGGSGLDNMTCIIVQFKHKGKRKGKVNTDGDDNDYSALFELLKLD